MKLKDNIKQIRGFRSRYLSFLKKLILEIWSPKADKYCMCLIKNGYKRSQMTPLIDFFDKNLSRSIFGPSEFSAHFSSDGSNLKSVENWNDPSVSLKNPDLQKFENPCTNKMQLFMVKIDSRISQGYSRGCYILTGTD